MSSPFRTLLTSAAVLCLASGPGLQASELDARIVTTAKNSYVFKSHLKGDQLQVSSANGVVTLTGTVADDYHRSLAEDTVAGLPGVKEVRNQLRVTGEPGPDSADGRLRAKVQASLLFHRNVSASRTKVLVKDGVVRLRGEADSVAQRNLTTEYVKDVDGVTTVVNEMTLAKPGHREQKLKRRIDDASITAQLKMALLFNRGTSALNTKVETHGGIVTLTGKAKTAAERDLCSRIANNLDGVRGVRNQMSVE